MYSNKFKKIFSVILLLAVMLCFVSIGHAEGLAPGKKLFDFLKEQIFYIALIVAIIIIIPLFLKKAWVALVTTLAGTAFALFFINDPQKLSDIGTKLYNIVLGG